MPGPHVEIPFPLLGQVDGYALDKQPPMTSVAALNVRGIDPATGRLRGAQRSGYSKLNSDAGTGFVQDIRSLNFDSQLITWTLLDGGGGGSPSIEWSAEGSSGAFTVALAGTRGGDIYAISAGKVIDKFNAEGTKILTVSPPLNGANYLITCVVLDEYDNLYIGVAAPNNTGQILRYELDENDELDLRWSLSVDGSVADLKTYSGQLFAVLNRGSDSVIRSYRSLAASTPTQSLERPVPEPCNRIAIDSSGNVFFASEANANRGAAGSASYCGTKSDPADRWTPADLNSAIQWAWLRADNITGKAENQEIDVWFDEWGSTNKRNLYAGTGEGQNAPRWRGDALCGMGAVHFDGETSVMTSAPGQSSETSASRAIIPGINNDAFVLCVMVKPEANTPGTILAQHGDCSWAISCNQTGDDATGYDRDIVIESNRLATQTLGYEFEGDAATTNDSGVAILTIIHQGDDQTDSSVRVNGFINGSLTLNREKNNGLTGIGFNPLADAAELLEGDVFEIVAIQMDKSLDPGTYDLEDIAEKIEGYLAHKFGVQAILKSTATAHAYSSTAPLTAGTDDSPDAADAELEKLLDTDAVTGKFTPDLETLLWAETGSGVGWDVVVDSEGGVYTAGASDADGDTPYNVSIRKIIDQGDTYSEASLDGAWTKTNTLADFRLRMCVDRGGNLYVPVDSTNSITKVLDGGASELVITLPNSHDGLVAIIDPRTADSDYGDATIDEPEFIYAGTVGVLGENTLHKIRLVDSAAQLGAPRGTTVLRVAAGAIQTIDLDLDTVATPTGGSGALDSSSRIVRSIALNQKVFYLDGQSLVYYDPKLDEVLPWKATGGGTLPIRPRLGTAWGGSMVLARAQGEPQNVFISEQGNPFGWDLFPAVPTATSAVKLTINRDESSSGFGGVPDVVNCLAAISDDLMLIGCDSSIWRLTGHPYAGGQLDQVKGGTMGMAFGEPWCEGPNGETYFLGSRGGLYVLETQTSQPRLISSDRLHREMRDIDFDFYTARLVWDDEQQGVCIFIVPIDVVDPTAGAGGPGVFQFSTSSINRSKNEGDSGTTTVVLTVERASILASPGTATVTYDVEEHPTSAYTATANVDFTAVASGTLAFGATEFTKTITVGILGDTDSETNEVFQCVLASVDSGGTLGARDTSYITIVNDDGGSPKGFPQDVLIPLAGDPQIAVTAAEDATPQIHYFYEFRSGAIWPDQFSLLAHEPTAVCVLDSDDPDDRTVAIGCADGHVRRVDRSVKSDDGEAINSRVLLGPIMPHDLSKMHRFSNMRVVMSAETDGATVDVFAQDSSLIPTDAASGTFEVAAGRSNGWKKRYRGQSVWIQVRNSNVDQHWSYEGLALDVAPVGRVRV